MSETRLQIGDALRAEIARRRLSQEKVAIQFNVNQSRISRVLKGDFSHRSELARALCDTYLGGLDPAEFQKHIQNDAAEQAFDQAVRSLRCTWDGSVEDAERLTKMLDALRSGRKSGKSGDASA